MPRYNTKQRSILFDYLSNHPDEQLSAGQIAEALAGSDISVSAVYRNLSAMEKDGKIKRLSKRGSREAYYQYTACEQCRDSLHLSCRRCGKTVHLDSDDTDILIREIASKKNFEIAKADTVLYGICENCRCTKTND